LDLNDTGVDSAGKFSEFAKEYPNRFKTIIIDWATAQHIRREDAWKDFSILLQKGQTLIVPVGSVHIGTGQSQSQEKAKEIEKKLQHYFETITIYSYREVPNHQGMNLLKTDRDGILKVMLTLTPVILFATK
jgi:hypothetical protein